MIICTNCGNHNEDSDEFCGSCGKFLEWVGQKVEDPVKVEVAEPEPDVEETKVGLIDRVKAAVGIEGAAGGGAGTTVAGAPPLDGVGVDEAVDPQIEAERARAAAVAEEQERGRLEADAADQAARERRAIEDAERAERERHDAEAAAAAAAAAQAAAEAAAREAAEEQARREAETSARERAAAEAQAAAELAERERLAAEAAAAASSAAEEAEQERLRAEARAAAEQAERDRLAAEAEAAAAAAAREAEEQARRDAEEAAAKARAEEEARRAAEAEEQRRKADEERARREAEARAEAARRAAALLAQPRTPAPEPVASDTPQPGTGSTGTTGVGTPVTPVAPVAPAPPKRGPIAPPGVQPGVESGGQPATAAPAPQTPSAMAPSQAPAKPKAPPKPATQVKADDGPKPGDLICDSCGTGNDPARKFCRKCGNSLAKAEPVKKLPWWKRLFSANRKKQAKGGKGKKAVAGARQASFKAEMAMARLRNGVLILAALGLAGGFMVPSIRTSVMNGARDGINKARDTLFPNFDPVRPTSVTASTEAPGHPAVASADLAINTFWAEGAEGEGIGQTVTYSFNEPFELAKILVTPGAFDPQQPDLYLKQPRPKDIHLVFDNGASADIVVKDEQKAQTFTIKGAKDIKSVQLSIASVYPGTGGADTAIAEVEFRKRA